MNKHDAAELGIRLLSMYMCGHFLTSLPFTLSGIDFAIRNKKLFDDVFWIVSVGLIILLLGVVLWVTAPRLARWLWRNSEESGESKDATATHIQVAAFYVVGIYLFVSALPWNIELIVRFTRTLLLERRDLLQFGDYMNMVGYALRFFIPLWLVLDAYRIVEYLRNRSYKS